jgi:hypothetical protein
MYMASDVLVWGDMLMSPDTGHGWEHRSSFQGEWFQDPTSKSSAAQVFKGADP